MKVTNKKIKTDKEKIKKLDEGNLCTNHVLNNLINDAFYFD